MIIMSNKNAPNPVASSTFLPKILIKFYFKSSSVIDLILFLPLSRIFRSYSLSYLLPKRSIYTKSINWYISIFMQSGLTVKWQTDSKFSFNLEHRLKSQDYYRDYKIKINLQHLEMAFLILLLGYVLSTLAFVIERFRRRRK